SVRSTTQPELQSDRSVFVIVPPPTAGSVVVQIVPDPLFSVPDERTLAETAYRIEITNLSAAADTFDVSIAGLAAADFTQAIDAVTVDCGATGVVGMAIHPAAGLPSPGTLLSFTVSVNGRSSGLAASEGQSLAYPAVVGVRPSFSPRAVATMPGAE